MKKFLSVIFALSITLNCIWVITSVAEQGGIFNFGSSSQEADASSSFSEIKQKLNTIDSVINEYYLYDSEIDQDSMIEGIYEGYVDGLDEDYTVYYTAEEYDDLLESNSGEYSGIGVSISQDVDTGVITVLNSFENGPAYAAGIREDDILYAVEGEEVTGVDINQVVAEIKGEEGTYVNLTIYRPSTDEYIDLEVERQIVQNPTVSYELLEDNIGYIEITEFDEVTVEQFDEAVDDLLDQGAESLIFDVRDNPGGLLTAVCDVLDRILPEGELIVYTMDKNEDTVEYYAEDEETLDLPMIVLTNENTASAAEIFTAVLQDYEYATVIGTTTYGKGIVQLIIPLSDGSAMKVTQSEYYTPNGVCIQGEGITPDILIEEEEETEVEEDATEEEETDVQLEEALEEMQDLMLEDQSSSLEDQSSIQEEQSNTQEDQSSTQEDQSNTQEEQSSTQEAVA